jgi:hypothetical protein
MCKEIEKLQILRTNFIKLLLTSLDQFITLKLLENLVGRVINEKEISSRGHSWHFVGSLTL